MFKNVIIIHTPISLSLLKEFHEKFLRDLGKSKRFRFGWYTEGRLTHSIIGDTTTVVEFFLVNTNTCMPDPLEVLANELLRHLFSHTLTKIIVMKDYFEHFYSFSNLFII